MVHHPAALTVVTTVLIPLLRDGKTLQGFATALSAGCVRGLCPAFRLSLPFVATSAVEMPEAPEGSRALTV